MEFGDLSQSIDGGGAFSTKKKGILRLLNHCCHYVVETDNDTIKNLKQILIIKGPFREERLQEGTQIIYMNYQSMLSLIDLLVSSFGGRRWSK